MDASKDIIRAPYIKNLNPEQRAAATHGDGPLLVVAGAGTGKTQTLVARVAFLILQGVSASRILLLTFTRRAAAEMLSRARRIVGPPAKDVWGGTFHATANRLLRRHGRAIGLNPGFTIMDQGDIADMLNLVRGELRLAEGDRRFPHKETLAAIYSRVVNAQEPLGDVLREHFPWCTGDQPAIAAIFDAYTIRKRDQHLLDYDDLLLGWNQLAAAPEVGDVVADQFEHILVDEYQDTNRVQAEILRNLRRRCHNLMVVGDDAQAIYAFRAATVRNILDFPRQFPGTTIVRLEQNYRSTQPILAASNAVMAEATEGFAKTLWSVRPSAQPPIMITCADEVSEASAVCRNVLEHLEQGIPLRRQAVLFRAAHHSPMLEAELVRRNIPFHKYGGLRFIEAAHIKDLLALLRILENPHDEMSWYRVLLLLDGVGPAAARKVLAAIGVQHPSPGVDGRAAVDGSPLQRLLTEPPPFPKGARMPSAQLRAALADCVRLTAEDATEASSAEAKGPSVAAQVERLRAFYEPILQRAYENAEQRLHDIEQLELIATQYRSRREFINDLALDPPDSTSGRAQPAQQDDDFLVLSTIHSAKGREWDAVHIIHAADGMIPSAKALAEAGGLDEERRVFYVALTRAKDWLFVYFPLRSYRHSVGVSDRHGYAARTRFVSPSVAALFEKRTAHELSCGAPAASTLQQNTRGNQVRALWRG